MNQRWPVFLERVVQGSLFTHYFLSEGVQQTPEYQQSNDQSLSAMLQALRECYLALRSAQAPDEADTEDDLIKPILEKLGFHYSRQKTPQQSASDRPDFLLFPNREVILPNKRPYPSMRLLEHCHFFPSVPNFLTILVQSSGYS